MIILIILTGKNANLPDKAPELTCNMPLTVSFFKFPQSGRFSSITCPLRSEAAISGGPAGMDFAVSRWDVS